MTRIANEWFADLYNYSGVRIMSWFIKNTLIGTILAIFFGDNWIDEKPKLAAAIKMLMSLILMLIAFGFVMMLIN